MAVASKKKIVVCADDYGMSDAVNQAVLQLALSGRLNATSCLVDGAVFRQGAAALREAGIQTGLHLNFTEKLAADQGMYMPLASLVRACWLHRLDPMQVKQQIHRQFEHFEQVMACQPDFVDGHQHVHQFPVIRTQLLAVLDERFGADQKPWLRSTRAGVLAGIPAAQRLKAGVVQWLGNSAFRRAALRQGHKLNPGFLGVYDFRGGALVYRAYLEKWLANAAPGDLLMCHPAAVHDPSDALGLQRLAEFQVLTSEAAGTLFLQAGIDLSKA